MVGALTIWSGALSLASLLIGVSYLLVSYLVWFSVWCPGNGAAALTIWSGGTPAQLCDVVYPEIIFSTPAYTHTGLGYVCNIFIHNHVEAPTLTSMPTGIEEEEKLG